MSEFRFYCRLQIEVMWYDEGRGPGGWGEEGGPGC